MRSKLILVLKLAAAALMILWVVKRGGLNFEALSIALDPVAFLVLGSLVLGQIAFNNWRWLMLLRGQNFAATAKQTFPLSLIGLFFNYAMPGSVGGDIIKGYYLAKDFPDQKVAAGVSVLMDRLIGFFVMMLSASFAILFFYERLDHDKRLLAIGVGTLLITSGFVLVLGLSLSRRVRKPLRAFANLFARMPGYSTFENIYRAMHAYRYRTGDLMKALALSMFNQLLIIFFFYFTAQLLGETQIPLSTFWFCVPVGLVIMSVPIAPAGVGVGQAAFYFLFEAAVQQPTQVGSVGITLMQLFQFALGLVGAFFYLKRGAPAAPQPEAANASQQ